MVTPPTVTQCHIPAVDLTLTWYAYDSRVVCPQGFPDDSSFTSSGTPLLGPRVETLHFNPNVPFPDNSEWHSPINYFDSSSGYAADCGSCIYYQFRLTCNTSNQVILQFINGGAISGGLAYTDPGAVIINGFANCNVNFNLIPGSVTGPPYAALFVHTGVSWTSQGFESFAHGIITS